MLDYSFAEFFAGIGLVRLGLERAGWRLKFANDICPRKRAMYETHFGEESDVFHEGDVHGINASRIPAVTLATASFPCTDLSVAGGRGGLHQGQSSAFWGFHAAIRAMGSRRPPLVLLENVPGFLSSHGGEDFRSAMLALNELGYTVDPFELDARRFVPQSRPRLFVVASRLPNPSRATGPQVESNGLRPASLLEFVGHNPDIQWRLAPLPSPPDQADLTLEDVLDDPPDDDPLWWSEDRVQKLWEQMSDAHRTIAEGMKTSRRSRYGTIYRRTRNGKPMAELRTDGLAGCLRTPKGGSSSQILFRGGSGRCAARLLQPVEYARLMGADEFHFDAPRTQALFGFADAVCVPAIEWIAENYLNPLVEQAQRNKGSKARPAAGS